MTWTLDVGPAIELKRRISTVAFCTGLTVYLEVVLALALLTERQLHVAALVALIPVAIAQLRIIRRPSRQFVRDRLGRSFRAHLALAFVALAILGLGTTPGTPRLGALILGGLVVAGPSWPALRALRAATRLRDAVRPVGDRRVIEACLSFEPREWLAVRLRAFGGERVRWTAPFVAAAFDHGRDSGGAGAAAPGVGR